MIKVSRSGKIIGIAWQKYKVLLNGKWIANTNFKELLLSISWEQAIQKVDNLNTIALLTFHINYYLVGILNVFNGGKLEICDKYSFDLPAINTEKDWSDLVDDFLKMLSSLSTRLNKWIVVY